MYRLCSSSSLFLRINSLAFYITTQLKADTPVKWIKEAPRTLIWRSIFTDLLIITHQNCKGYSTLSSCSGYFNPPCFLTSSITLMIIKLSARGITALSSLPSRIHRAHPSASQNIPYPPAGTSFSTISIPETLSLEFGVTVYDVGRKHGWGIEIEALVP